MGQSTDAILFFGVACTEEESTEIHDVIERMEDALKAHGVEAFTHCSGESPMLALAIEDTIWRAKRGFPLDVDAEEMAAAKVEEWREKIRKAIWIVTEAAGEDHENEERFPSGMEIGWYLVSDWN